MYICQILYVSFHEIVKTMERGRPAKGNSLPEKYSANNYHIIYTLCLLGLNDGEIGDALGLGPTAINYNKLHNEGFRNAINQGRVLAKAKVAESLYKMAVGYEIEVEEVHTVNRQLEIVKVKKFVQPNPWAAAKILALRDRDRWAEAAQTVNINRVNTNVNVDLQDVSLEDMIVLEKIGYKQLSQNAGDNNG